MSGATLKPKAKNLSKLEIISFPSKLTLASPRIIKTLNYFFQLSMIYVYWMLRLKV